VALTAFFGGSGGGPELMSLLPHVVVNALFAPLVSAATETSLNLLGDEDAGRRLLQLEPRKL
jgi:hypothetical protein